MTRKYLTKDQVAAARQEFCDNENWSIEYLAAKYDTTLNTMYNLLSNRTHHESTYVVPTRKVGGRKKVVFIPDHIQEAKEYVVPFPTTAHRARGQNGTINRFK